MTLADYERIVRRLGGTEECPSPVRRDHFAVNGYDPLESRDADVRLWAMNTERVAGGKPHTLTPTLLRSSPSTRILRLEWRGAAVERIMDEACIIDNSSDLLGAMVILRPMPTTAAQDEANGWCVAMHRAAKMRDAAEAMADAMRPAPLPQRVDSVPRA